MAKFNGNIYTDLNEIEQKEEIVEVLPMLQEMMSKSDFEKLKKDYQDNNGSTPFWKFVFDNVEVIYTKHLFHAQKLNNK